MPIQAIICFAAGAVLTLVGLILIIGERRQRKTSGDNPAAPNMIKIGELEIQVSTASLFVVVLGVLVFLFPLSPLAPDALRNPREPEGRMVYCEAVERRASRGDCETLTRQAAAARPGAAAFNAPEEMVLGETVAIQLAVDRRALADVEARERQAAATAKGGTAAAPPADGNPSPAETVESLPGRTQRFRPRVGRFMTAHLAGPRFEVRALAPETQEIPAEGQAVWQWDVTAREVGRHPLILTTTVEAEAAGKRYRIANSQTTRLVDVYIVSMKEAGRPTVIDSLAVDQLGSLSRAWALGGLLAAVALSAALVSLWLRRRRARRQREREAKERPVSRAGS